MRRTLIRNNIIIYAISFILFFVVVSVIVYWFNQKKQEEFMYFLVEEVELSYQSYDGNDSDFVLDFQQDNDRRITILDENGFVLADSHDAVVGTDKSQRPEIVNLGSVVRRHSATIDVDLIYTAIRLDDGKILRVSIPLKPQAQTFNILFFWLLISGSLMMILNSFILKKMGENLYQPWIKVRDNLVMLREGRYQVLPPNTPYPEINQIIHEMNTINLATAKHVDEIEDYQSQLSHILNEMDQAVLLTDQTENILFFNDDAKTLFKLPDGLNNLKSYRYIREVKINEAISSTIQDKKFKFFDLKMQGKLYEIRVFPVTIHIKDYIASVLITLKNVTHERAVEAMKKDFFSHASHELKSPLTAIKGYAELIEFGLVKDEEIKKVSQNINKQVTTMNALVEDMLMLSRLENITDEPNEICSLTSILDQVVEQLKPFAMKQNIELQVNAESVEMKCDQLDIYKLFKNLVENAIKYSDLGKKVEIQLTLKNDDVFFSVKDYGIGIAEEHQSRVFERFYRIDKGRIDTGTGLGLAIVKHVVLKYQGKINLESGLSKGTKITVELPIK